MHVVRQSVFVVPGLVSVAERLDLFAAAGVVVDTRLVSSSAQQWADLRQGRCEVAVTAADNLLVWNAAGSDVALLAQVETTTALSLVLRAGLGSVDRVARPRLAVDAPDNGFAVVLRTMLAALGRTPDDHELVEVGGVRERYEALAAGAVDGTLLSPPLDERAVQAGMTVALRVGDVAPTYPGLVVVAPRTAVTADPEPVVRWLAALSAAREWLARAVPVSVAELLPELGAASVASLLATRPSSLVPDRAGLQLLVALRAELGMVVDGAPAPEELLAPEVLAAVAPVGPPLSR